MATAKTVSAALSGVLLGAATIFGGHTLAAVLSGSTMFYRSDAN